VIEKGQTLVNPVTGERMTFLETAAETRGDRVVIELHADPGGSVAAAHVHPGQWETFDVVAGTLGAKVAGRTLEAVPGTWDTPGAFFSYTWLRCPADATAITAGCEEAGTGSTAPA